MTKFAVAILLVLTMPASAEDLNSANYFLPGCKGFLNREKKLLADEALMQGLCAGFVDGLVFGAAGKDICPPKGATRGQARAVVIKYIEARPERMHERFDVLAYEALIAAWPCKR